MKPPYVAIFCRIWHKLRRTWCSDGLEKMQSLAENFLSSANGLHKRDEVNAGQSALTQSPFASSVYQRHPTCLPAPPSDMGHAPPQRRADSHSGACLCGGIRGSLRQLHIELDIAGHHHAWHGAR